MFSSLTNVFFGGHLTDTLSSSRSITRKAWNELKMDDFSMSLVYQMSIRGLIKKQKIIEIDGNEPSRIGGERKMHRIPTGIQLASRLLKELSWRG